MAKVATVLRFLIGQSRNGIGSVGSVSIWALVLFRCVPAFIGSHMSRNPFQEGHTQPGSPGFDDSHAFYARFSHQEKLVEN
jgi:hypothetical protein